MSEIRLMGGLTQVSPRRPQIAEEEDERIIELVKQFGQERWSTIAAHLPGLTEKQCRERWRNHLRPNIIKDALRQHNELALVHFHQAYGNKSAGLTESVGRRASYFLKTSPSRPWTAEEDEMLRMAVQCFKIKGADLKTLGGVVAVQCFKIKGADLKTLGGVANSSIDQRIAFINWRKIVGCFEDRTEVDCIARWHIVLTLDLVEVPLSKEEDEIIIRLVKKYGQESWSTVAGHIPGRTENQCRERWHNHLNPNINNEAWTHDEELALIRAHQIYGNKWEELAKFLPRRTENAIENHCVEKKLDMYVSSGLPSQFRDLSLESRRNHQQLPPL